MNNPILIHYNNTKAVTSIPNQISFEIKSDNIDHDIIDFLETQIVSKEPDIILIKDSLSNNYLEFYGLLLAHHIRLSDNEKTKYVPIVIISDLNIYQLSKLTPLANICYTEGVYLIDNELSKINKIIEKDLKGLNDNNFNSSFLHLINIDPPSNYDSRHSIANEWSIHQWANFFDITISEIEKNISSMLYFKYLESINSKKDNEEEIVHRPTEEGKILLIDDEWEKGWEEIFEHYLGSSECNVKFKTLKKTYKNMKSDEIVEYVIEEIKKDHKNYPDVILLDLRLCDDDFSKNKEEEIIQITGMKLINKINKLNPGIQIILWTASGDSNILNKTNIFLKDEEKNTDNYKIIGYVKKEYPGDRTADVYNSIKNLTELIDHGLKNKYLKDIWNVRQKVLEILEKDPVKQHIDCTEEYKDHLSSLKKEVEFIFDILDSNKENKLNYAVVSMARSLEVIEKIFIVEQRYDDTIFWDKTKVKNYSSIKEKILSLIKQKMNYDDVSDIDTELEKMIEHRNAYMHSKSSCKEINPENVLSWFELLDKIIDKIMNPLSKPLKTIEEKKVDVVEKEKEKREKKSLKPIGNPHRKLKKVID